LSRITVATALVFAFLLSTVPVQAQPRGADAGLTLDISWFEAALGWLESFLGGDSEGLQSMTTNGGIKKDDQTIRTGPCLDPFGCPK
jgi:hypothetical protein